MIAMILVLILIVGMTAGCRCSRDSASGDADHRSGESGLQDRDLVSTRTDQTDMAGEPQGINLGIPLSGSPESAGGPDTRRMVPQRFIREYERGVELMAEEKYGDAVRVFESLLQEFPNSEEASIAAYAIADIHFRNKANRLALDAFKKIVEKYPDTHAAENARAGIEYLETFHKHEEEYVSPEVEGRMRRGY